jgi:hypothetical protein
LTNASTALVVTLLGSFGAFSYKGILALCAFGLVSAGRTSRA